MLDKRAKSALSLRLFGEDLTVEGKRPDTQQLAEEDAEQEDTGRV